MYRMLPDLDRNLNFQHRFVPKQLMCHYLAMKELVFLTPAKKLIDKKSLFIVLMSAKGNGVDVGDSTLTGVPVAFMAGLSELHPISRSRQMMMAVFCIIMKPQSPPRLPRIGKSYSVSSVNSVVKVFNFAQPNESKCL